MTDKMKFEAGQSEAEPNDGGNAQQEKPTVLPYRGGFGIAVRKCVDVVPEVADDDDDPDHGYGGEGRCV